jgi:hypothetical protein
MTPVILALALLATPFPAPKLAFVTDKTKCDAGTVTAVDTARGEVRVTTAAGLVTFKAGADVQVFDAAGQPAGSPARLGAGDKVRVWYVVDDGAKALEIAKEAPALVPARAWAP